MNITDISKLLGTSRTTVQRRLVTADAARRKTGRVRKSYSLLAANVAIGNYSPKTWATLAEDKQECWTEEITSILKSTPFPYPAELKPEEVQLEMKRLRSVEIQNVEGSISPWSSYGIRLCRPFFPNRYRTQAVTKKTAYEAWHNLERLRKAVRFQLRHGDPVFPHRVLRALTMQCRTPTVFRPTVAKYIYNTYCPVGGRVWDPCAGYGGRLLGAAVAGVHYIGTDVDPETVAGNLRLAALIQSNAEVHLHPAETFDPGLVDLVFTSPPYFKQEHYLGDKQSWKQHGDSFDAWVEGFLSPIVETAFRVLKPTGYLILNVADIQHNKKVIPLVERALAVALSQGFALQEQLRMPLAAVNRTNPGEPVLVFRKP